MYISQVEIDLNNRKKTRDLTHLGAYHNWVEMSFPDEINKDKRSRKLWRVDKINGKSFLLLVSESKPNLKLFEKYGVEDSAKTKYYDLFLEKLKEGQVLRFRATLNPIISKKEEENKRGKIYPCYNAEDQMKFLIDRSEKNGFILEESDFEIVEKSRSILRRKGTKHVKLNKVVYEGRLKIIDKEKFLKILKYGMGREKAYGFGMFTVIPVK
ncbi:type I-E CRISPR-associated protein Cas6/Cse3/CasE [Peptoniphilus vaginalis]|uniref:type I-E CRISPR-associated protein Cas6/Cse3/CasE n=1 Tax=Peptoniphilus vaginalis TaxID=1756987 RepID=UPI000A26CCD6|nr:type I-E CRISPR-associated protein Cas6/Cse3/CasE [Peptoniphilus vaginalis]